MVWSFSNERASIKLTLEQSRSKRDIAIRHAQNNLAALRVKASDKAFRHDRTDLFRREIHHSNDQLTQKVRWLIQIGDLSTRFLDAYFRSKIDTQHISWLPRFRKNSGFYNSANSEFDF